MTSQSASLTTSIPAEKSRQRTIQQTQRLWGWVFLSPWIFGFLVFYAFPMLASLVFSFTDFTIGQPISFVGLAKWQKLLTDPLTRNSLGVTFKFMLLALPIGIVFPLTVATILNSKLLYAKPFFRVLFYMPYIVPAISGIFIWQSFLNGQTGYLNRILRLIGIENPPNWIFDANYINTALVLIGLWGVGNAMLTMMASMQGVPTELYEAATVDGAGLWTTWRRITLPMISPVIFYNLVLTTIGLMQYFVVPYVISNATRSDPSTYFINLHLYRTAFQFQDMGYAAALAWFIFAIALVLTIGLFITSRRWVYYASGD
jgi:multiple sugar transport system permease protein